jgi:hypothetical protein
MVKKVANLSDPLFNTEIKEAKATQFFGAKGDAAREMLVHTKFFQDSGNCLLLDAIKGRWIESGNAAGISHSRDVGTAMENEGIHLGKSGSQESMGKIVSLGLEKKVSIFVVPIRSDPDAKSTHSFPRVFPLDDGVDWNTSFGKGDSSRGRDGIHHLWPSIGPFPVDEVPETLWDFESITRTVKDPFPRLGSMLQMPHNFSDRHRVILMGITYSIRSVINKGVGISFIRKILPWVAESHSDSGESRQGTEETDHQC